MKSTIALLGIISLFAIGCVTTPSGERKIDSARVARLAGTAAQIGATEYLTMHPEHRVYFEAVANGLSALDAAGDYDPVKFATTLEALPIRELKGPKGTLYVNLAVVAWQELSAESARLDKTEWVKPVMQSVQIALTRALDATNPVVSR